MTVWYGTFKILVLLESGMSKYSISSVSEEESFPDGKAKFIAIGLGGGGGNAVAHMVDQGVINVTFVCANTDAQALNKLSVPHKLQLGTNTRGLGAGGDPEKAREAAEQSEEEIRALLEGYDMVFIAAGMGGGTGTGSAPVVARIAKEMGILSVAVVTTPFFFEGHKRQKTAKEGISRLLQYVDSIITIPNDKLTKIYGNLPFEESLKRADDVLLHAVNGLAQTIVTAGVVNIDFNDIRTAMTARGHAMMGLGRASGDQRASKATEAAIRSPLLDDLRLENAQGLLVNITASDLVTEELVEVASVLGSVVDLDNGNIFYGIVNDESMGDEVTVTVVATGLSADEVSPKPQSQPAVETKPHQPQSQPVQAHTTGSYQTEQVQPTIRVASPNAVGGKKSSSVMDFINQQR